MEKPSNQTPAPAVDRNPSDNYISSAAGPPPAYPPGEQQPHSQQPYELPKYGAPTPDPNGYYGGQQPPPPPQQQHQQSFAGPQNFAPYGTPLPALGPHPAPIECPDCHARGVTAVEYSSGGFTHSLAAIVCFVTCLGCIPYFFTSLKDARHKCAKCGIPLATYHRSGRTEVHWHGTYHG